MVMDDQDQDSTGILWEMGQPLSFNFFLQLRDLYPHFHSLSQEDHTSKAGQDSQVAQLPEAESSPCPH